VEHGFHPYRVSHPFRVRSSRHGDFVTEACRGKGLCHSIVVQLISTNGSVDAPADLSTAHRDSPVKTRRVVMLAERSFREAAEAMGVLLRMFPQRGSLSVPVLGLKLHWLG
jgi:hypothetical protein